MTHQEYVDGLRQIADFFEQHPEVSLPHNGERFDYYSAVSAEDLRVVASALGHCTKKFAGDVFQISRHFGAIEFVATALRSQLCTRRVIGVKRIKERVIPAHDEDIVEWDCPESLLAKSSTDVA